MTLLDHGTISVERVPLPARRRGEVDVAISAAAICGSDVHTVSGHRSTPPRTALGHEGVGVVVEVDNDSRDLRGVRLSPGDRVVFALFRSCGDCDRCLQGLPMKCRSLLKYGHESVSTSPYATGTLATHVRLVPGVPVVRLPEGIDDARVISAGCAVATASAIVSAAQPREPGSRMLVLGAGAVGAYCAAMLLSLGNDVTIADPSPDRRAIVERFGAHATVPDDATFRFVVEASGSADAFAEALARADLGGRVIAAGAVSPGSTAVSIDPATVVTKRLSIVGIHNYLPEEFLWGVDWLLEHGGAYRLEDLVSPPVPLEEVHRAFELMEGGRYHRVLVSPGPDPTDEHGHVSLAGQRRAT